MQIFLFFIPFPVDAEVPVLKDVKHYLSFICAPPGGLEIDVHRFHTHAIIVDDLCGIQRFSLWAPQLCSGVVDRTVSAALHTEVNRLSCAQPHSSSEI